MPTIALRFPAGRYHATPWGRHVNEGDVEWPPSPWRVLRSLLATGFTKLGWTTLPDDARALIGLLAAALPSYRLPAGIVAHTRHYMPVAGGTTKVIDAFIRLDSSDDLLIHFPVALSSEQRELLDRLVASLGYFGRAESWVDGRLVDDIEPDGSWARPVIEGSPELPERGSDQVALLAPVSADAYMAWREAAVAQAQAEFEARRGKKPGAKDRERLQAPYPDDLLACLLVETAELQRHGWSQPPGSRRVLYNRPPGTLERRPPRSAPRRQQDRSVEAALLALASDTRSGDLLPLFERCLPQAELLHQSLISLLDDRAPECTALSGRDAATGRPLAGRHQHAHYLPLDLDEDGRLDHVIVHAPMGLDALARSAIQRLRRTWTKGDDRDLVVTCAGFGNLTEFAAQLRLRSGRPLPALAVGRQWASITPFVPPRHLRGRGHTLEDQVRDELRSRDLPRPIQIEVMAREELGDRQLLRFVRSRRSGKPQPPAPLAFGLRLIFDEPVRGPVALGYASHYGLGVFAAEASSEGAPC